MVNSRAIKKYIGYLQKADPHMPAFLVDRISWVILSRFNRELGEVVQDNYVNQIPAERRGEHLYPSCKRWGEVYSDCEYYLPDYHSVLGFFPFNFKNVQIEQGEFEDVDTFKSEMPEGMRNFPELDKILTRFNLDQWEGDDDEGVYLDYRIECISGYDSIKHKRSVRQMLKTMESPGEYDSQYYGLMDIIGFYIEADGVLYHTILTGGYGYDEYVPEECVRPSYSLELLWLDTMIEEQKEVQNGCA